MMLKKLGQRCEDRVKRASAKAIPWELIIAMIIELVQNCFNNEEELAETCASPSMMRILLLRRQCRQSLASKFRGRELSQASYALADAVLEVGRGLTEEEVAELFAAAQGKEE